CSSGDCGDGGPAVSATLAAPMDVVPMPDGSFYVVEYGGHAVRYVTASDPGFRIGGTISGLADGAQVVLQNNGGDDLTVSANGTFRFATKLAPANAYSVTVLTQPGSPVQICTVTNGSG